MSPRASVLLSAQNPWLRRIGSAAPSRRQPPSSIAVTNRTRPSMWRCERGPICRGSLGEEPQLPLRRGLSTGPLSHSLPLNPTPAARLMLNTDGHTSTSPPPLGERGSRSERRREGLRPPSDEEAVFFGRLRPERRAGFAEPAPHPPDVVAVGKARVRALEPQRDRVQPVSSEVDEKRRARSFRSFGLIA